jgi:hypothetical protein
MNPPAAKIVKMIKEPPAEAIGSCLARFPSNFRKGKAIAAVHPDQRRASLAIGTRELPLSKRTAFRFGVGEPVFLTIDMGRRQNNSSGSPWIALKVLANFRT